MRSNPHKWAPRKNNRDDSSPKSGEEEQSPLWRKSRIIKFGATLVEEFCKNSEVITLILHKTSNLGLEAGGDLLL